jgi:hypothetical protein
VTNEAPENAELIVTLLFQYAMSKDKNAWCSENEVPANLMASWKERYHREYITYIENMMRVIRDRVE